MQSAKYSPLSGPPGIVPQVFRTKSWQTDSSRWRSSAVAPGRSQIIGVLWHPAIQTVTTPMMLSRLTATSSGNENASRWETRTGSSGGLGARRGAPQERSQGQRVPCALERGIIADFTPRLRFTGPGYTRTATRFWPPRLFSTPTFWQPLDVSLAHTAAREL